MDKIDLHRLKADIAKYVAAGVIGSNDALIWHDFHGNFESSYVSIPKESPS